MARLFAAFVFAILFSHASAFAEADPLKLDRRVTDFTGTLAPADVARIESYLADVEQRTSNQIVVLMVPSLGGRDVREYAVEVAQKNGIGQKGKDNGALLFIAKDDRQMSIEVGYGLEGVLPDAIAFQIIRREITPRFRQGDFAGGVMNGVSSMVAAIGGEYKAPASGFRSVDPAWLIMMFMFLFFTVGRIIYHAGRYTRISHRGYRRTPFFIFGPGWTGGFGRGFGGRGFGGFSGGGGSFGGGGARGGW
jgi:uncharacterized protein